MKTENDTTTAQDITTGTATYCPEDNCLRLYIGRVPRAEYLALKAEGWRALYKQREAGQGDFVATWTPERRDTALRYSGGVIDDEDAGPEERAADRAERFAGYLEKREGEALGHADRFEAGPAVHGFQNYGRRVCAALNREGGREVMNLPSVECDLDVSHPDCPFQFRVSFMWDYFGILLGVAHYRNGEKRPPRRKHLLLTDSVRNWIGELQITEPAQIEMELRS